jgi:hypothetical protein
MASAVQARTLPERGEIDAWEAANGVLLPDEYRLFLLEVGNGGRMAYDDVDFEIWSLGTKRDVLKRGTFPITESRLHERLTRLRTEGREACPELLPELKACAQEGWPLPGCLHFGVYPGGDQVFMVTTGELRGTIWTAVDDGVPECDRSGKPFHFLSWFEDVLLEAKTWR